MKIFASLYDTVMRWSRHRYAVFYLGAVSFIESSFFPIPTSMMLAPMVMADRSRAWKLAAISTITSVLGGVFGYLIGWLLYEQVGEAIVQIYRLEGRFLSMQDWFHEYGVWLVLLAGVTPIPYKLFTITSGVLGLAFLPFVIASLIGRAVQFYLVAALVWWGGAKIESVLEKWIEWIGWGILGLVVVGFIIVKVT